MIRKIANLAIDGGRIKDLDALKTTEDPFTSADANVEYVAATDVDEGN